MTDAPIRFENLSRVFGKKVAVRDLSLEVRRGEVVALLGANGAGKTTAIKALLGHLAPSAGRAVLLGHDAGEIPPEERRRVGYMAEGNRLDPWVRVDQMVRFVRAFHPTWNDAAAARLLEWFGLPLDRKIGALSNGQRGQLALVLSLVPNPEVLVLDDPMLGIDAGTRAEFLRSMGEILSREPRSVLFTTQFLPGVERLADRVAILSEGRLLALGSVDFFLRRVRRYRFRMEGDAAPPSDLPGLLHLQEEGRGYAAVSTAPDMLRALAPVSLEEEEMTFEEVFIALTAPRNRPGPIPLGPLA